MAGGRVCPQSVIDEISDRAHERGIPVHMDGARVFNAAAAVGRPVCEIVAGVDTVMFCLSKALGAPVGSMLAGPRELIDKGGCCESVWAAACGRWAFWPPRG
jgi:threonine aldolase